MATHTFKKPIPVNKPLPKSDKTMKSKSLFILFAITLIAIVPLASATISDEDVSFRILQNSWFDITRPCVNAGHWCSATAGCNLTVVNAQTGTIIINNGLMTNQVSYHNYTLTSTQTTNLGFFKADMQCSDGTSHGANTFYYKIVPAMENNTTTFLVLVFGAIVLLALAYLIKNEYVSFMAGLMFAILGVYTMINGFNGVVDLYTRATALISLGIGFIFIFLSAYHVIGEHSGSSSSDSFEYDD